MRTTAGFLAVAGATLALAACGGSGAASGSGSHHRLTARTGGGSIPAAAAPRFASDQALPSSGIASTETSGRIISYIGFNPSRDGFAFQNYGFIAGQDLDPRAMRELFGNQVCATAPSDNCTLTPAAEQWAQANDANLYGGHCFGFSRTALRFFRHLPSPSGFGAGSTYALSFSRALQSEIAANFITQYLAPVQHQTRAFTPAQIIPFLEHAMADHNGPLYSVGIYSSLSNEGHAITPIGIEDLGGGRYYILVYDNNKPGTVQGMQIDTNANTWSYLVAINPQQHDAVWRGQGQTNPIQLTPLSAVTGQQPCPFCRQAAGAPTETISLGGDPSHHAHLLITTPDGHRIGFVGGRLVDEIPGARVIRPLLSDVAKAHPEPVYQVPARDRLRITVQAGSAAGSIPATVYVTGPGFGDHVANLTPGPSSGAQITVAPDGASLTLRLTGTPPQQSPSLGLASDSGRGGHSLSATPTSLATGTALSVGLRATAGRISVRSSAGATPVALTLRTVTPRGTRTVTRHSAGAGARTLTLGLIRIG